MRIFYLRNFHNLWEKDLSLILNKQEIALICGQHGNAKLPLKIFLQAQPRNTLIVTFTANLFLQALMAVSTA